MARKLSKSTISELMSGWGRKGGSRATQAQRDAARANLKKTPNYVKHHMDLTARDRAEAVRMPQETIHED